MTEQSKSGWYFLIGVIILYLIISLINLNYTKNSILFFINLLTTIIPIIFLVFILMTLTNYFISPERLIKYIGREAGIKKYFLIVLGGIISTGPIYMWYPLLSDLHEKGLSYGLIACFLYNRSIKIPLIPLMVFYFNLTYVLILGGVMVLVSIIEIFIVDKIMKGGG